MLTKSTMLNMSGQELLEIGKQSVHQEDVETVSDVYNATSPRNPPVVI